MDTQESLAPIGMFDSGVGGLSVLRALWNELPAERVIYLADQAHVPYGSRPLEEVREFADKIAEFLLSQGVKLIIVACNTASAAALNHLRSKFPTTPFVGMEPALKPASQTSQSKVIGILATPTTFQGELYASLVDRYANGIRVLQDTCPGLVGQIERGEVDVPKTRAILEKAILPMLEQGADRLVLGCTHYPFVMKIIQEITGTEVQVIDPAPAVARQTRRVLEEKRLLMDGDVGYGKSVVDQYLYLTTGEVQSLRQAVKQFLGKDIQVSRANWKQGRLSIV